MALGRPRRNDYVKLSASFSTKNDKLIRAEMQRLKLSYSGMIERVVSTYFDSEATKRADDVTRKLQQIREILK